MRILIHPGFHKTGTKSVQRALEMLRPTLPASVRVGLQADIPALCDLAREVSVTPEAGPGPLLALAKEDFRRLGQGAELLLISAEDLAGALPGRRGLTRYARTPEIMATLVAAAEQAWPGAEVHLHFTTRNARDWLASLWWQNLRSTRNTESLDEFSVEMAEAARLTEVIERCRHAAPEAVITQAALEDCAGQPAAALLRAAGLDDLIQGLPPVHENARPDLGMEDVLLSLNRCGLPDRFVRDQKQVILRKLMRMQRNAD